MVNGHQIDIAFGRKTVPIYADPGLAEWEVIRPAYGTGLPDAGTQFREACRNPIGCVPLREVVSPGDRVVIVTSDGTRPVPNRVLIPWILEELPVPVDSVTVLLGNGTHRANTDAEIVEMFGEDVAGRVAICNHDGYDPKRNAWVGKTAGGTDVFLDRGYLEAEKRIVVGFIEPHFFAGFSGGAKGVVPGVAGVETVLGLHRAELIADPRSTWGVLVGNPIQAEIAEAVGFCPPDFMVNVTLNADKEMTGIYAGDYRKAHRQGCAAVKALSMAPVAEAFPVVVTSNSGYPLDQNLYQTVKGISAAARVVADGGAILVASECSDGVPDHGNFAQIMRTGCSPGDVLRAIYDLERPVLDQWQAQILAGILEQVEVAVYSRMEWAEVRDCKLEVAEDLDGALRERIEAVGKGARVAVLPDGPLTIPYVEGDGFS